MQSTHRGRGRAWRWSSGLNPVSDLVHKCCMQVLVSLCTLSTKGAGSSWVIFSNFAFIVVNFYNCFGALQTFFNQQAPLTFLMCIYDGIIHLFCVLDWKDSCAPFYVWKTSSPHDEASDNAQTPLQHCKFLRESCAQVWHQDGSVNHSHASCWL